ncbi:Hypothetical predicted protein [Paramuricea clavata]|uniref:SGNH hydrolase-type esterase domain-containing protein n=1 Tax=Paramuricea clavata TaxID=317549 RepID=A0A7D9LNX0_PARCT|nr:Hypothetical predicted protein [Paramuricea clavata]CAB4036503.1 Hypothetical predicted protein [Paramuricea clavata]
MAVRSLRASPYARTFNRKYCLYFLAFLAADLVLICAAAHFWYSQCNGSFCTTMPQKPPRRMRNILAFGDSITKGFIKFKPVETYHPYSRSLMKTLNRVHSKDVVFVVENHGLNGDRAIGTAQERLRAALSKKQYEWVIILMGTNDLIRYFKHHDFKKLFENDSVFLDKLFENIKKFCEMALRTNAMVILGTITAWQCEEQTPSCDPLMANREALNAKIRNFGMDTKELLILADFDKELQYKTMSKEKRKQYWQDDVHFTETGYEAMAKLVYKKMLPYLPEMMQQPHESKNFTNV